MSIRGQHWLLTGAKIGCMIAMRLNRKAEGAKGTVPERHIKNPAIYRVNTRWADKDKIAVV